MGNLSQSLRRIPYWAYLLVIVTLSVNTIYLIYRAKIPWGGETIRVENGFQIIDWVRPGGSVEKAGIKPGDTLVSMNSMSMEEWDAREYLPRAGDTIISEVLRNGRKTEHQVIVGSIHLLAPGFFWFLYITLQIFSISSLLILYKKPSNNSVVLFFISIQLFMISTNAFYIEFQDPIAMIALIAFMLSSCLIGPSLVHFHLLFPRPAQFLNRYKRLPFLIYILGFLIFIGHSVTYSYFIYTGNTLGPFFDLFNRIVVLWMTVTFTLALLISIFQFRTVKETLLRNQLRIVIVGAFFAFITPMSISLFYDSFLRFSAKHPIMIPIFAGIGSMIMICCILFAIFRYRIWDMEIIIRKALLYIAATLFIILTYLFLLWLIDRLSARETAILRFIVLGASVILFLVSRDLIQRLIDRLFHRETYDSASVVSVFEAKLAGIYRFDELKQKIAEGIEDIFHFRSFMFNLKGKGLIYEPVVISGTPGHLTGSAFVINSELEEKLRKSKVFSPEELAVKPAILEETNGELIVPLVSDGHPAGFFLCGQKKSERIYSRQDIQVLVLLAQRVVALLHTSRLHQNELDRQLMLERERARISQDMHDDVGASLTRISMMSDLVKARSDVGEGARQWLGKISDTSRGLMEEMNQIIWALNPKNDNLNGLIAYLRRFAFEYLEPTGVKCVFDLPEEGPDWELSVEVRRNIYLVVREALHNVVKHAGATEVIVTLTPCSPSPWGEGTGGRGGLTVAGEKRVRSFSLSIRDNGKGFEPEKLEFQGNGLINMKKRMNDIGGEFLIHTHPGEGTEIELVFR